MQRYALVVFMLLLAVSTTARGEQGKILGEVSYTLPSWFKESFLEIREDVDEARQQDKHVMLFMHIDRCPYCTRMIQEDFARSELVEYIQANFDVIALNIRGDREVAWDENTRYSEKELAKSLGVQYTPTIVFLDARGEKVYQMHGYRKPAAFGQLLHYIAERQYETVSLVDYLRQQEAIRYTFRDQPRHVVGYTTHNARDSLKAILIEIPLALQAATQCEVAFQEGDLFHLLNQVRARVVLHLCLSSAG